jgi:preprotein translocase subunit YajC
VQGDVVYLAAAAAEKQSNSSSLILFMVVILAAAYFLMIRPSNKRRREQMQVQGAVRPGDRIMTTTGMYATVAAVDDDGVLLEIAPGVEARFVKQAIMRVIRDEDAGDAEDTADADEAGQADADGAGPAAEERETVRLDKDADDTGSEHDVDHAGSQGSAKRTPGKPSA